MYSGVENASVNYAMRNETKKDNIFKLYLQGDTRVMETRLRQEPKHLGFLATASRSLQRIYVYNIAIFILGVKTPPRCLI